MVDKSLNIGSIKDALQAELIVGAEKMDTLISGVYASDLMSDVLAYGKAGSVLLTGLNTVQAAISSYMAEFPGIVFLRGKKPAADIQKFARDKGLIILSTYADMFEACIKIAMTDGRLSLVDTSFDKSVVKENVTTYNFNIDGKDFASAGLVSTKIKSILNTIGYNPLVVRRVAISIYEGEMNVVMHASSAHVTLVAGDKEILIVIEDEGKGIPDVSQAMQQGFSTATEEQRALGFGSGMGLPNIKKNADDLKITSAVGKGTRVEMRFYPQGEKNE